MKINFEWDATKAVNNLAKHKVSFEGDELRWQTLGMVEGQLILLVAHLINEDEDGAEIIRIISARKADRKERTKYEKNS